MDDANVRELPVSPQLLRLWTMTVVVLCLIQFFIISSLTAAPTRLMRSKLASGTEGKPQAGKGRVSNKSNGPTFVCLCVREWLALRLQKADTARDPLLPLVPHEKRPLWRKTTGCVLSVMPACLRTHCPQRAAFSEGIRGKLENNQHIFQGQ